MESYLIVAIVFLLIGIQWGKRSAKLVYENSFRRFTDEVHEQYLYLLDKHGIKRKKL